jgi:hypothetical protein
MCLDDMGDNGEVADIFDGLGGHAGESAGGRVEGKERGTRISS